MQLQEKVFPYESQSKTSKEATIIPDVQISNKDKRNFKKQGNITSAKEHQDSLVTDSNEKETYTILRKNSK